jgi:hypothetical protein
MREVLEGILASKEKPQMALQTLCPKERGERSYWLKCRIHPKKVNIQDLVGAFADFEVKAVHMPVGHWRQHDDRPEAFVEFESEFGRKLAQTINETYVCGWQLRLFTTCKHALADAKDAGLMFETREQEDWSGDDKKRWKATRQRRHNRADGRTGDSVQQQRDRVKEGVRYAEGIDELDVLRQRAIALGLHQQVKEAARKLESIRDSREAFRGRGSPELGPSEAIDEARAPSEVALPPAEVPVVMQFQ